jgi:addiction module RelE/StbE family toxin
MIQVAEGSSFKRAYKRFIKSHPDLEEKFRSQLTLFIQSPHDPRLQTHSLSGKLQGRWAFSINWKYRVVFYFKRNDLALLEDIGTHDDVY